MLRAKWMRVGIALVAASGVSTATGQTINALSVGQITWQDTAGVPYAVN